MTIEDPYLYLMLMVKAIYLSQAFVIPLDNFGNEEVDGDEQIASLLYFAPMRLIIISGIIL